MTRSFGDGDNSIWKKVGEDAVKTAINTLIEEGIEATVEIWKKRRLKIQEEEIEEMASKAEASVQTPEPGERKSYPGDEPADDGADEEPGDDGSSDDEQEGAAGMPHEHEEPAVEAGASVESFGNYVARAKGETD